MGCETNDANRDATTDPEYNLERLHTPPSDEWYYAKCKLSDGSPCPYSENCKECVRGEEPADHTYHPREEKLMHQYAPQDTEIATDPNGTTRVVNRDPSVPAYLPNVNTTLPDPAYPAPEPDNMHIVYYGTIEDVAFADTPPHPVLDEDGHPELDDDGNVKYEQPDPQRRNGLTQMSIRDEYDDLIHTDFHTLNPLSLLNESNVWNGKRVRVDIQDYKNVIEWFVYNYPMELVWYDKEHPENSLLIPHSSDGVYKDHVDPEKDHWTNYTDGFAFQEFRNGMLLTEENAEFDKWWNDLIAKQPWGKGRKTDGGMYEDWEYEPGTNKNYYGETGYKELHRSFLEIGQMDGNKKISLWQFLEFIKNYFHLDDLWWIVRNHELRISYLEWDTWKEDRDRNDRSDGDPTDPENDPAPGARLNPDGGIIGVYEWIVKGVANVDSIWSNYRFDGGHQYPDGELYFTGNSENRQFSLRMDYRDSVHNSSPLAYENFLYAFGGPVTNKDGSANAEKKGEGDAARWGARICVPKTVPKKYRPHKFHWVINYGIAYYQVGAWEYMINYTLPIDIGFDPDGSIWVSTNNTAFISNMHMHAGIFGQPMFGGNMSHFQMAGMWVDNQVDFYTFGGIITMGDNGSVW